MSAAAEPIRIGVAGLGRAFTLMLPTFLADARVRLVAACDPRAEARARFTADFDAPAFEDIAALAAHPEVEAVYVATPHQFHAAHTLAAAAAGKHVLLEKPMALTLAECDLMIGACRAAGVRLIVGHCHSFDAPYLHTRALLRSGDFGRVRMIQALNYTDFLYRPRRPEELQTSAGGGVVFSQAAHQVDVVRLLAGSPVERVRAVTGAWDPERDTEGAYAMLMWFRDGVFASLSYNGYGHFDTDEWTGCIGEMGTAKNPADHGGARRRLAQAGSAAQEARLKNAGTYGGPSYQPPQPAAAALHQHFGPVIVSCDRADLRPVPDGVWIHGDAQKRHEALPPPAVPRSEVIDELHAALRAGTDPLHDGPWARSTLAVCLALLRSSKEQRDVAIEP
ncbi:MAG: 4,5-dihydroxyphthalate dehydrogenase [Ramlibacter sp.]|nr:4,5-dihydroxyphthalate dehydrogenase [Ramlibacter sp.]